MDIETNVSEVERELDDLRMGAELLKSIVNKFYGRLEKIIRPDQHGNSEPVPKQNRSVGLSKDLGVISDNFNIEIEALERLLNRIEL